MSAVEWMVSGESGKRLDATRRPAHEVGLSANTLELVSLDVDRLSWTIRHGTVPDELQKFALWRNGVRVFSGTITTRKYRWDARSGEEYQITASGALWEMSKAQIVDDTADAGGTTAARPTLQFPTGDLRASVLRLLDKAPGIQPGTVAEMFPVTRRTFTGGTWLSVLMELLRPVADVSGWVDYSQEPPALNIERRPFMETLTVDCARDAVSGVELNPRSELMVTGIALASATRGPNGKVSYQTERVGDGSQVVAVSGPEVGAFVPPDDLPSATIRTAAYAGRGVNWWVSQDAAVIAAIDDAGPLYGTFSAADPITLTDLYELAEGQVVDFLKTDYGLIESEVHVAGWFRLTYSGGSGWGPAGTVLLNSGRLKVITPGSEADVYIDVKVPAVNLDVPTLTTLYAKAAYDYLSPPSGMAEGMLAAANWKPHEGMVNLTPDFLWQRFLGKRLNVLGADPTLATAGALIQGAAVNLATGAVTLKCGAPGRVSLQSAVGRYSAPAKDNFVNV